VTKVLPGLHREAAIVGLEILGCNLSRRVVGPSIADTEGVYNIAHRFQTPKKDLLLVADHQN
jgi:hypothetical protein